MEPLEVLCCVLSDTAERRSCPQPQGFLMNQASSLSTAGDDLSLLGSAAAMPEFQSVPGPKQPCQHSRPVPIMGLAAAAVRTATAASPGVNRRVSTGSMTPYTPSSSSYFDQQGWGCTLLSTSSNSGPLLGSSYSSRRYSTNSPMGPPGTPGSVSAVLWAESSGEFGPPATAPPAMRSGRSLGLPSRDSEDGSCAGAASAPLPCASLLGRPKSGRYGSQAIDDDELLGDFD